MIRPLAITLLLGVACGGGGEKAGKAGEASRPDPRPMMDSSPATTSWTQRLEEVRNAARETPVTRPRIRAILSQPTESPPPSGADMPEADTQPAPSAGSDDEQLIRAQRLEQLPKEWRRFVGQIPEGTRIYVGEAPPLVTGESPRPDPPAEGQVKKEDAPPPPKPDLPARPIPPEVEAACGQLCAHLKEAELKGIFKQCMDTCRQYVTGQ